MQSNDVAVIGVPIDLGAGRRGVDMGPSAIRYAGLDEQLTSLGYRVCDTGNLPVPIAESVPVPVPGERLRYLNPIAALSEMLARRVEQAVVNCQFPLVLGGDHSLAIGSIAGSARGRRIGLLWVDAHADFNTPETTPSGNIHGMPVAALVGRGHPALTNINGLEPVLQPERIAMVGIRTLDSEEREALRHSGIRVYTMTEIDRRGIATVVEEALSVVLDDTDGFHLSFDMDVMDPREAPGVGTPLVGGVSYREAHLLMEMVAEAGRMLSMDVVEVNPILDEQNTTARLAVELIASALGKRIL